MDSRNSFESALIGMQEKLFSFAMKLTATHDEAHDLVQDTTLKALDSESKFIDNVNFKGWLFTIMRNIFINNYRKSFRENTILDRSQDYLLSLPQDSGFSTPEGSFEINEISGLIKRLPEEFSKPFSMHVAGYKYEEISEILGVPVGTVKSRIFSTRKKLRVMLGDR